MTDKINTPIQKAIHHYQVISDKRDTLPIVSAITTGVVTYLEKLLPEESDFISKIVSGQIEASRIKTESAFHRLGAIKIDNPLERLISFLERTKEESWCMDVVKTKDGKSCLLGHVFDWCGNVGIEWFEAMISTTYMFYPVNDGKHPKYQQETSKQRCLAYLKDILSGDEPTANELFELEWQELKQNSHS